MSISKEVIEAGARVMDTRALPRDNAIAALTAAAPYIQAAALRDAADDAAVEQPFLVVTWLRARADQLEKGQS